MDKDTIVIYGIHETIMILRSLEVIFHILKIQCFTFFKVVLNFKVAL